MPRGKLEPPVYTFRVRILGGIYAPPEGRQIWREIEVTANEPLADLGAAIPAAFGFADPHLWSFFLSGKAWDTSTEYAMTAQPGLLDQGAGQNAAQVRIRDAPYPGANGKKEFLFLFDYGDEWHFGVKLLRIDPELERGAHYPRVTASAGAAPPQYPEIEDDEAEPEDDGTE